MEDLDKAPKVILITGASSGIGKATVELFSRNGWLVAATMRNPEKTPELGELPGVRLYTLDVTREEMIQATVDAVVRDLGQIDVLLNNAGYGAIGVFEASTGEQVRLQFETNVFGVMNMTRAVLPHFRAKRSGRILMVSSVGGQMAFPVYSLYHGTKWAIEGFSESLQYELRQFGIQVKLIEPGPIRSDFFGRSQDFLKSPALEQYDQYMDMAGKYAHEAGKIAQGPEVVARKILRAACDRSGKLRYPVGWSAPILLILKRYLPNRLFLGIVRIVMENGL